MSAISTTGMDTASGALVGLHNYWIDLSLIAIMILGAISFFTHYLVLRKRQLNAYTRDREFQLLLVLAVLSTVIILPKMVVFYQSDLIGLEYAFFHAVSAITCGGFSLENIALVGKWDDFVKLVLIGTMLIGGAAGSTAGGIKLSRFWIFLKSIYWKVKRTVLPKGAHFSRKFEGRPVESEEVKEISQFILIWIALIVLGTLVLTLDGADMGSAFFEVVSAQSNVGISSGLTHSEMPVLSEVILIFNMWIGRLEIIPLMAFIGFALSYRPRPGE
jgi:trk system potassium uptake protein TrkH